MAWSCAVLDRTHRSAVSALLLAAVLTPQVADAQSTKLEAVYVVLGPQGAVARAIIADATGCPAIAIDGTQQPMNVRAPPDAAFPVMVCEMPIPAGTKSASIMSAGAENSPLPLPGAELKSIAAFGDTGCRLKAAKGATKGKSFDADDEDYRGKFQDCNVPAATISTARAPVRRATPAARAVPTATTGRHGKPISSPPRQRRYGRRLGSWCAAITKSAAVPAPATSGCSTRRRPKAPRPASI
jgi:hypothetical protein